MGKFLGDFRQKVITRLFHKLYYHSRPKVWTNTFWLGIPIHKCPLDLWVYQEILFEIKPDVIIESGTGQGGSALFFASICDLIGKGRVISIDLNTPKVRHKRITCLSGSSVSQEIKNKVQSLIKVDDIVLVNLDSAHTKQHVLQELKIYSNFVSSNSYIIVEDTNVGGHPVEKNLYPGPMEAVKEFLKTNSDFSIDKDREKFFLTFNANGYLRKLPSP